MPEPGFLPFGVLPSGDSDRLGDGVARPLAVEVLNRLTGSDGVETGRIRPEPLGQHRGGLFNHAASDHLLGARGNPLMEHRPWRSEYHVPGSDGALGLPFPLPVAQRPSGEQCHFYRACRALPPATLKRGIETERVPHEVGDRQSASPALHRLPGLRVHGWLDEEAIHEGAHIEPGSSHHDRHLASRAYRLDPSRGLLGEETGAVAMPWFRDIDPVMRHTGEGSPGRLGRANVEPAIDLARVGGDDLERPVRGQREGDRRLADARGSDDDGSSSAGQTGAPAPRGGAVPCWRVRARRAAAGRRRRVSSPAHAFPAP